MSEAYPPSNGAQEMRLQKYLARAGVAGRRRSEELIAAGRVSVNGEVISEMGVKVVAGRDEVLLDGKPIFLPSGQVTVLLNKPAGVYSTMREQAGRPCVADYLPMDEHPGLYHVGRLDRDTTGALLFTTDGELGQQLLHPSHHVGKEYVAQVKGAPTGEELDRLRSGIVIRSGEKRHSCAPAEAELLGRLPKRLKAQQSCLDLGLPGTSFVRLVIHEGVKHQVKLMMGAIGHPVVHLHRASVGPVDLGGLPLGAWRYLELDEVDALARSAR